MISSDLIVLHDFVRSFSYHNWKQMSPIYAGWNFQESYYEANFVCSVIKQYMVSFMIVLWIANFSSRKKGTIIKQINGNCM